MSLRFMKRMSILPGVRLNFSGSGISTTIGVPGASVTLGGRNGATLNLGLPGTGISYRQPLKSAPPVSPPRDGLGGNDRPLISPLKTSAPIPELKAIQSDAVSNITTPGLTSFHDLIIKAQQQRDVSERELTKATEACSDAEKATTTARQRHEQAEQRLARLEVSWLRAFRGGTIAATKKEIEQAARATAEAAQQAKDAASHKDLAEQQRDELWLDTEFSLSGAAHAAWTKVSNAFDRMSRSERMWDITAYRTK